MTLDIFIGLHESSWLIEDQLLSSINSLGEITGIKTRTAPKVLRDRIPSLLIVEELAFLFV